MPLSESFIKEQKKKLLEEKKRLESELKFIGRAGDKDYKANYENLGDDVDENALEVSMYEQNVVIRRDLKNMLDRVEAAIESIKAGSYGKCEKGDEVEKERLSVIPWAATCMRHSR